MRVLQTIVSLALAGAVLAGCGYRGPLYLPGQEPVKKRRAPAPAPAPQTPAPAPAPATQAPAPTPAPGPEAR